MLFPADLLWRWTTDLKRVRSVWPENAAEQSVARFNTFWNPLGRSRPHVGSGHGGIRAAQFIDEDDPLWSDIERANRVDKKLRAAGPAAVETLRQVFAERMRESRIVFGQHVGLWPDLHGAGNLAELCPAAIAAWTTAMARRSKEQRARLPVGVWLDRLGDRIQRKHAEPAEVSLGYVIQGWCDGALAEAVRRYEGRAARAA